MSALELEGVRKSYGRSRALDGLSLKVPRGSLCAVVGPNGSGKTTFFAIAAGLLRPDAGKVGVLGQGPFDLKRHAGRLSLMPQDCSPSRHARVVDSLTYYGELAGCGRREARREAERWLERVQLQDRARARWGELSHGMKRRFSVAQALMGDPELVLLDEPTAGLDPELAADMRELFRSQRGHRTLLISSHVLLELEQLCDHVLILERGRLVRQGSLDSLREVEQRIEVTLNRAPELDALREALPAGLSVQWREPVLEVSFGGLGLEEANAAVLSQLIAQGVGISRVEPGRSLEATYLATRAGQEARNR